LDTIEIYDGVDLWRRIKLHGEQEFRHVFEMEHGQMQQPMLRVTDVNGLIAYSGPQQDGHHFAQDYFCGDRINGSLFHGPGGWWDLNIETQPGREFAADGYDGFTGRSANPYLHHWDMKNDLGFIEPNNQSYGGAHCFNYLVSEDARLWSTTSDYSYPLTEKVVHAWFTYGPLLERQSTGTVGWARRTCGALTEFIGVITFKKPGTITSWPGNGIDLRYMGYIPGNKAVIACAAGPDKPVYTFTMPEQREQLQQLAESDFRIGKGGFLACYGTNKGSGACNVFFLDDYSRKLIMGAAGVVVAPETLPVGTPYKVKDTLRVRTLGLREAAPDGLTGAWYQRAANWLGLGGKPGYQLKLDAGVLQPVTEGFCDIDIAPTGYTDMTWSPDPAAPVKEMGVRLLNGNSHWSMFEYRPSLPTVLTAYVYFQRYIEPVKREVTDGLKPIGNRLNTGYFSASIPGKGEDPLRILAGHPVIASDARVCISVTALSWKPYTYAVEVNNPTDETLTVTFKPALPLPNFPFQEQTVKLAPGELKEIFRNGE
jgi:hypothetical protein